MFDMFLSRKLEVTMLWLSSPMTLVLFCGAAASPPATWSPPALLDPQTTELAGPVGDALRRGVSRMSQEPYTVPWLRADVSFEVDRIFTNYSGDVSGRFLELAALTSPPSNPSPASLMPVLASIAKHQKADGHFGVEVDLAKPLPRNSPPIPKVR
jgi:hypothetical protein